MEVDTNCSDIKKRRMVGIRESEIKEITSLVFSFDPRTFFLDSKNSSARFRRIRKNISKTRITLIFVSANIRISLDIGREISTFNSDLSSHTTNGIRERQSRMIQRIIRFFCCRCSGLSLVLLSSCKGRFVPPAVSSSMVVVYQ